MIETAAIVIILIGLAVAVIGWLVMALIDEARNSRRNDDTEGTRHE